MKNVPKKENFSVKGFLLSKLLLIAALICEVIAYLMSRGILQAQPQLVNGLTVAGVILLLIYLVKDELSKKYRYYSKKWGIGPYAEPAGREPEDSNK